MDAKIKAEWLELLRSGQYKQGRTQLHNVEEEEFCCLGVLCEMAVKRGIIVRGDKGYYLNTVNETLTAHYLPDVVTEWAGLKKGRDYEPGNPMIPEIRDVPNYESDVSHPGLAHLNDSGLTFAQIADVIEAQF